MFGRKTPVTVAAELPPRRWEPDTSVPVLENALSELSRLATRDAFSNDPDKTTREG